MDFLDFLDFLISIIDKAIHRATARDKKTILPSGESFPSGLLLESRELTSRFVKNTRKSHVRFGWNLIHSDLYTHTIHVCYIW